MFKLFITTLIVILAPFVNACVCPNKIETSEDVYDRVDGIYQVVIVGINIANNSDENRSKTKLILDLKIIDTIKGKEEGILKANAYGNLPIKDDMGKPYFMVTSCDIDLSFGKRYILALEKNESIKISMCSPQILKMNQWNELEKINKKLQLH